MADPFKLPEQKEPVTVEKGSLELKTQEFMPTILIGLGGTGKEVLLRIRRQFVEKYGSLDDFPITSYLYIDTDNAPAEESGIARERDYLINEIDFKPSEKVFNPVNPSDYIHRINDIPHIKEWLNVTGEIGKLGTMNTGAGQIRPAARLAFYHNFDEIVYKLSSAKSTITDSRSINIVKDKHNIKNVNTEKINVYVITSISGGTGSGMFIDFGFLIRHLFRNQAVSSSYIVLPKIYQGYGKERVFANGYAALTELEYYNLKNPFTVSWKKNEPHKFQPGVYDDVYLIDGENCKNLSLSEQSNRDIYKMIADTIFQDFSNSDFANYKRGVRVNLVQYKQRLYPDDNTVTENTFSRKYSTLGQSTISIPVDRIILSCAYKLCEDIINYYLTFAEGSQSSIDEYLREEMLPELGIIESNSKHQLLNSLYSMGEKSSIQSQIKTFLNNLKNELVSGRRGDKWSSFITSEKQKFDTNFRDDNDITRKGLYYSQIYANRSNLINKLIGDRDRNITGNLERKINSLINDSTRGVFYAMSLLRRMQFILTNGNFDYIPAFEKEIKDLQILVSRLEAEVKSRMQDLREDESRSKINIMRKAAMEGTLDKLVKVLDEYYNALIKLHSRYYAKEICQRILALIERGTKTDDGKILFTGLISDLNKLTGNLGILKENFKRKYEYFIQKQDTSFNLHIYEPDDVKNEYYLRYIGSGQSATDRIKVLAFELLKELNASDVTDIVNILKDSDAKIVEGNMLKFARKQFEGIREDYNITEILFEKEILRSESKIRGMLNQSFPWLRINEVPGRFKLDDSAKKFYIGIRTNTSSFGKFKNLITSIAGNAIEFKDSADNSSITFYTEWAGFPLFYSYTISEEMKNYYKNFSKNSNIDLHNNKNYFIYNDIIPLTNEERKRYDESYKAFILGLIFGLFEIDTEYNPAAGERKAVYKYTLQEGITVKRTEQLGIEARLINRLFEEESSESLRIKILKEAESLKKIFIEKKLFAELLLIFEYYYENIYKLDEIEISGEAKKKTETYQYKIVRELAREIENLISADSKDEYIAKVKSLKNHLDNFSFLCGDGKKRVLNVKQLLEGETEVKQTNIVKDKKETSFNLEELQKLKRALDENLITQDEYETAKKRLLNLL
ncbi:MAG: tubulin-like doman-containing protein [Ignavibacteria bacterium]|nr:tubulin-like doman-containing protein [Ignavibacteria bacterium]